jgi:hypothetical protein
MKIVAFRELLLYVEDPNTRCVTLNLMGRDPLDAGRVVAVSEQFLNPIQGDEFLDLLALPARDLWPSPSGRFNNSGLGPLAEVASWRCQSRKRTRSG